MDASGLLFPMLASSPQVGAALANPTAQLGAALANPTAELGAAMANPAAQGWGCTGQCDSFPSATHNVVLRAWLGQPNLAILGLCAKRLPQW